MEVTHKTCQQCKESKLLALYYKGKESKYGVRSQCKACMNANTNTYNEANRARINEKHKINREKNIEERRIKEKAYRDKNRNKVREWSLTAQRKYRSSINGRLSSNMRSQIHKCLTRERVSDTLRYIESIGCNHAELKQHIESLFTEGMNWDNYGSWHIDHIKPCSSFDLSIIEQQLECFNFSNLQPLWAQDNWDKGSC